MKQFLSPSTHLQATTPTRKRFHSITGWSPTTSVLLSTHTAMLHLGTHWSEILNLSFTTRNVLNRFCFNIAVKYHLLWSEEENLHFHGSGFLRMLNLPDVMVLFSFNICREVKARIFRSMLMLFKRK